MEKTNQSIPNGINPSDSHARCEQCGGIMVYSMKTNRLKCLYCGNEQELSDTAENIPVHEYGACKEADDKVPYDDLSQLQGHTLSCPHCGAQITFDERTYGTNCPSCGSPAFLSDEVAGRHWKPDAVLPFKVEQSTAARAFRKWIRHQWLVPEKLRKMGTDITKFKGYYMPYWVYDAEAIVDYKVDYNDNRIFKKKGKFWVFNLDNEMHKSGHWEVPVENVPVAATNHFENLNMLNSFKGWDFENRQPFNEDYLRGYTTELYTQTFATSMTMARKKIEDDLQQQIPGKGAGSISYRHWDMKLQNITFSQVLLPVWVSTYRYGDTRHSFVVNARTGEVWGTIPISWWKVFFYVLGLVLFTIAGLYCEEIYDYFF